MERSTARTGQVDATAGQARVRRRRRSPEVAEAEIIAAAEALLRERPFRELTVDEVMRRTDLSRPSFYVYFRDRHHLVLKVVEHLGSALWVTADRWLQGAGDGPALVHEALEGIVAVFEEHGPVLRALSDAATDDPDVEEAYGGLVQSFIDGTARHIDEEIAAGRILPLPALETATALVLMNERYLNSSLGRAPMTARREVVDTLSTIWRRTLYGVQ
jgi:AcrR family transcriptional regulator